MSCRTCQEYRDQLRAALTEARLLDAGKVASAGIMYMIGVTDGKRPVVSDDRAKDGSVSEKVRGGLQK